MGIKALDVGKVLESEGLLSHFLSPYEFRPQQLMMAQKIEEALKHDEALLVEAGTGVGKTLAYLIPALLSRKRVVVSTGTKNLQEQIKEKEIPFLKGFFPFPFKVSFLKGRSNYLCLYRYRHFESSWGTPREDQAVLEEIHSWVDKTSSGDRAELLTLSDQSPLWKELSVTGEQCLGGRCDYFNECFVTQMRQEAMKADLLIVNHHLFFADLALREEAFGKILPPFEAVIFDEAHLLEEIARPFFGHFISSYRIEELEHDFHREMKIVGKTPEKIGHGLKHIREASDAFFGELRVYCKIQGGDKIGTDELKERRMRWEPKECPSILLDSGERLIDLLKQMEKELSSGGDSSEGKRSLADRTRSIQTEMTLLLKGESPGSVSWVEVRGRGVFLQSTPVDISEVLRSHLFQKKLPVVLTSATLTVDGSFNFLKRGLGIHNAEEVKLDSPFDFKNQLRFYFPTQMVHPRNSGFVPWAAREIVKIIKRTQGRAFVLVTSYRHLEEVYALCKKKVKFPLLKQGDQPRHQLLQEFQSVVPSVLFATTSFWQGVDVQGSALSCVIILKLPFASPEDPLTVGKTAFLRERGEDPFYAYQLPKAVIQLKQGVGRLIRTGKDRGIIALLDKRVLDAPYGDYFLKSLPSAPWTRSEEEIERFLNSSPME